MANYIRFVDEMSANDAIDIIRGHIARWKYLENDACQQGNYHSAQSYKDMAYAGDALLNEIEKAMVA